jgi:hypothetical protein
MLRTKIFLLGILFFNVLTARRCYKTFSINGKDLGFHTVV